MQDRHICALCGRDPDVVLVRRLATEVNEGKGKVCAGNAGAK